jgi:hypothetical protein
MAQYTLGALSDVLTDQDAVIAVRRSPGKGGAAVVQRVEANVVPGATTASPVAYPLVRVPSDCVIKKVSTVIDAVPTTFTADITLGFPSAASPVSNGAAQEANGSTIVNNLSGASAFFQAAHAFASDTAGLPVEVTFRNVGNAAGYKPSKSFQPLWQAAGLQSNPGGMLDIILLTTLSNVGANVNVQLAVEYVPSVGS